MTTKLPPLNALRVFEAISRHLSAKHAAEELHVTPAAVSHQLKLLEHYMGCALFHRLNRRLQLTDQGYRYSLVVQKLFHELSCETDKLKQEQHTQLTLSLEPALAIYWLLPRLDRFKKQYPQIELRISSSYDVIDLRRSSMDAAIRWGQGHYPGLASTLLFRNQLYPVCSPDLWQKHPIHSPNDLKQHTLLHETAAMALSDYPDWTMWRKQFNAHEVNADRGLFLETGYLVIQAAIEGQGVALERAQLVAPAIRSGQLVKALDACMNDASGGYYFVCAESRALDPKITAVKNWLLEEVHSTVLS